MNNTPISYYSCEKVHELFGNSEQPCNNGDVSVNFLTTANINTQNRAYQREKVSTVEFQQGIMETVLKKTYAGIPEIHIRVIETTTHNEYRYEVIDGQQRTRAILDFLNGLYVLPENMVVDGCDVSGMNVNELRSTYPQVYNKITAYRISCKWYECLTDQETADLFIKVLNNVNDMKPQELRNAILGFYSNYVRDTARGDILEGIDPHPLFERYTKTVKGKNKEYLTHFSSKFVLAGRMEVDEWLSSLIFFIKNGWKSGLSQDAHHKWVETIQNSTNGEYAGGFKDKDKINKILNFALELMKSTPVEYKSKLNPMTSLMMVVYALELRNRGYIVVPEKFSPAFFDTYERWSCTKAKLYINETMVNGNQMKEFSDLFGGKNANAIGTIFKVLDMDWEDRKEQLGLIEIDPRETFSREDILKKWREQGGLCFYTEKQITEDNIAGDHFIPRSWGKLRGGVTEYSNLVVCTKGLNTRKGNMSGDDFIEFLKNESKRAS